MKPPSHDQEGIALVVVLLSLVVLGALVSISFLLGLGEMRLGRGYVGLHQALGNAEGGTAYAVTSWDPATYNAMPVGQPHSFSGKPPLGPGSFEGTLTRIGSLTFVAVADGFDARHKIRQRTGLIVKLNPLAADPKAALTTAGPIEIGPSSLVDGQDRKPAAWDCSKPGDSVIAGLLLAMNGQTSNPLRGCNGPPCILGTPRVVNDDSLSISDLMSLDGFSVESLEGLATKVIGGGPMRPGPRATGETCVTAARDNWGDPYVTNGPCGDYFPLVFSSGDLQVIGGRGQGTLVVAGDLSVGGGFHFVGFVLVKGTLVSSGTGNRFEGAVVVANGNKGESRLLGSTAIEYSSCALERAAIGSGRPKVLRERGWFQAY
jgi:hypothetical protein